MDLTFYERLKLELSEEKPFFLNEMKTLFIVSLEDGIASGLETAYQFVKYINPDIEIRLHKADGFSMKRGDVLLSLIGMSHQTFALAKIIVRIISRMSGIATLANHYVNKLSPSKVLDAHFYTPGIKSIEKQALLHGGVIDLEFRYVSKEEIKLLGGLEQAYHKLKDEEVILCYEIVNLTDFYDILRLDLNINYLMLTGFNDDQLKQIKEDNTDLTLIVQGVFPPSKLEYLQSLNFPYIETSFLTKASRNLEIIYAFE